MKFFIGNQKPEGVIKAYHNYVNGYILHPFWAQGFHQCRWGYNTSQSMIDVWNNFTHHDLPFDVIWSDIDYMVDFMDFTIDKSRYNDT